MEKDRKVLSLDRIQGSFDSISPSNNRNHGNILLETSSRCTTLRHGTNTSSSNGYVAGTLPLPDNFFPVPQLNAKEKKHFLGLAKHACKEVIYYSRQDDGPMKWIQLSSHAGVNVFQGVYDSGSTNTQDTKSLTYLRGACKIRATIDEVSDFFKLDTPEKLSGYAKTVGKDLLDQRTLLTLATPTPENPKHYVAIKWSAVESPSKVARNRDFCYIECHDEFIDSNTKRRGWVKSIHSIRLPFCPPLHRSHGLVRGSFYRSGYIFTESADKGCVDAVHTLHLDIKGNAPDWLKILVMKRRIRNIAEVDRYFQLQRLAQEKLLGDLELPKKEKATRCQICDTRFGFFHRRRICRKCGKVVCTPCGNEFLLDYAGLGLKKAQVCMRCSESVGYETIVPMMNDANYIVSDEQIDATKFESIDTSPRFDGSMVMLENRYTSADEHEYYVENEDENEIADVDEANQMDKEFEETLKKTSDKECEPVAQQKEFNTSPRSLVCVIGVSRETMTAKLSSGETSEVSSLKHWCQKGVQDDNNGTDNELGLPLGKTEQILHQIHDEDQKYSKQTQKLHRHATDTESQASITDSSGPTDSDLGLEYYGKDAVGIAGPDATTNFLSNGSDRCSRSERTRSKPARSRPECGNETRHYNDGSPRDHVETAPRCTNRRYQEGQDREELQRCTQQHVGLEDAQATLVNGCQQRPCGSRRSDSIEQEYQMATRFLGSDPPIRHALLESKVEDPCTSLLDSLFVETSTTRQGHQSGDLDDQDDEAFRLAMLAMRLYEEERGPSLQVPEKTRQVALTKMMEVYAREIESSHSNHTVPYRGTISDTRRLHYGVAIQPLLRQTHSDDRPPSYYGSPLSVFSHDKMVFASHQSHRRALPSERNRGVHRRTSRENTHVPILPAKQTISEEVHEYRDLSDLTSSAFQAFHTNSLELKDALMLPVDAMESFQSSACDSNGFQQDEDHFQSASVPFQRSSTCGTTHVQVKADMSENLLGAACTAYGSKENREVPKMMWRANSMYGVADLDTFSDMDLIDLPHLMRNDDVDIAVRSSLADLQRWTKDDAYDTDNEGVKYIPKPRLSALLSPLHLEGVQHVDDDYSEGRSSNASSQVNWRSSLQNKHLDELEGHGTHFLSHRLSPQRRYSKPPSMMELLSEYCDSERSSLPSYLEFGESQPELEPEYLEAIENANNQKSVPVEGRKA
ncbi:unnamed protein product [Peronospora belbahrii]|uniref:FYVE-type domain-containing protein n=1 Tax=Peronospora belbahrii TaxID=622444 RepID=A0AAU9LB03_9STRA|nr:unnamed protein product [Peronospora belbahrii]